MAASRTRFSDVPARALVMPIASAAKALSVSPRTVARWIEDGAPCVRPGGPGRGRGALVNVADLRAWRARRYGAGVADSRAILDRMAEALWDVQMRDAGTGLSAHEVLHIPPRVAAAHLAAVYPRICWALGLDPDEEPLPEAIDRLLTLANPT